MILAIFYSLSIFDCKSIAKNLKKYVAHNIEFSLSEGIDWRQLGPLLMHNTSMLEV